MAKKKKPSAVPSSKTSTTYVKRTTHEPRPVGHNGKNWVPTKTHAAPNRNTQFQELPPLPSGSLHLDLAAVLPPSQMSAIKKAGKLVFHLTGDVGGILDPNPQQIVADHMEADIVNSEADSKPAFMYIVGDVVYFDGQSPQYFPQFYQPYEHYPAPIFAIPGNHDGEVDPADATVPTLEAFMKNFCAITPVITSDAGESHREAMTQPYCYWTLDTPFATLVGIYTNVPEGGEVEDSQVQWLINELKTASKDKALIFSLHHPLFSLDQFHAGSLKMLTMVNGAFAKADRIPDIIFAGHVHNYQRFTWLNNGQQVPQLVVGNCGYHNLHAMAKDKNTGNKPSEPEVVSSSLTLESYVDDRHGFLRLEVDSSTITGKVYSVPKPSEDRTGAANLEDKFVLNYKTGKYSV